MNATPVLLLATSPEGRMDEGFVGSATRVDADEPEVWAVALNEKDVSLPNVVNALVLLLLDYHSPFLPRILLPYQPPYFLLCSDGRFVFSDGKEIPRDRLAISRTLKMDLVEKHRSYFDAVFHCFSRGEGCREAKSADKFYDPSVVTRYGPQIPPEILQELSARRG